MMAQFIERACQFGEGKSLFGILSTPAKAGAGDNPAVVILNTGTAHRVGHHRMYVSLARKLAAQGYPVFRFDFAGIGDSRPSESGAPLLEANLTDIRGALDWLEADFGVRRFVLVGLCSGADYAVMYSHTDPRIVGLTLLDPYVLKTARYILDYLLFRVAKPRSILRFRPTKSRLIRAMIGSMLVSRGETGSLRHISFRGQDARATLEAIYTKNVAAGMQILVLCTGIAVAPKNTYEAQFADSFKNVDFKGQLQARFLRDCDHLFSSPSSRDQLNDLVLKWIASASFPTIGSAAEAAHTAELHRCSDDTFAPS
jgi:pimeloyl-ACP methyl ester carboxylesterase